MMALLQIICVFVCLPLGQSTAVPLQSTERLYSEISLGRSAPPPRTLNVTNKWPTGMHCVDKTGFEKHHTTNLCCHLQKLHCRKFAYSKKPQDKFQGVDCLVGTEGDKDKMRKCCWKGRRKQGTRERIVPKKAALCITEHGIG